MMDHSVLIHLAKAKASTTNGVATIKLQVPGNYGSGDGRYLSDLAVWFQSPAEDDFIEIYVMDDDNLQGGGVVTCYIEDEAGTENSGAFVCPTTPLFKVSLMGEGSFIPSGLYLTITGTKGDLNLSDTLRCNIKWGKDV